MARRLAVVIALFALSAVPEDSHGFNSRPTGGWSVVEETDEAPRVDRPDIIEGTIEKGDDAAKILGEPRAKRDMGQPLEADRELLAAIGDVHTNPGDIPQLKVEVDGKKLDLPLKHTHVKAEITGSVGRVEVTQTYQNPFDYPIEAIYIFPLPENSAVDDMKMIIGERVIEADIKKRAEARKTYEQAKRDGHTAALLEQERPNIFTQSVANIEPGTDIDVVIRYLQNLTYDAGQYEFVFPMVVGPRFIPGTPTGGRSGPGYAMDTGDVPDASRITPPVLGGGMRSGHDISLELVATAGFPISTYDVPTHEIDYLPTMDGSLALKLSEKDSLPNRDFVLRYRVDGKQPQATVLTHANGKGGYLSLIVQPPKLDIDELVGDREIVFVIDVSGSMHGVPLSMCKDAMQQAIGNLRPVDTFQVITFSGRTGKAFEAARPANDTNIKAALQFVDGLRAGGGTYMLNAVQEALGSEVADGRHRYVFFLTDGYVGNEQQIFAGARDLVQRLARKGQKAKVFGFGVGSSTNRHLLDGLAKAGNGVTVYASTREDPTAAVNTFYRYIDHSILEDVAIDWGGLDVDQVVPTQIPDLFASRPVRVHARYGGSGSGTIVVRGKSKGRMIELPIAVELPREAPGNAALATLWARSKISWLERDLWNGHASQAEEAITQLGLDYRIVTRFTSFVAVDRSKKVNGELQTIVQPVETPEGVDAEMAGAGFYGQATAAAPRMRHARKSYAPSRSLGARPSGRVMADAPAPAPVAEEAESAEKPRAKHSSPKAIRAVIQKHQSEVKACYARATRDGTKLSGRIVVRFFVTARGVAIQVKVESSTVNHKGLEACLVERIKKWTFPAHGGSPLEIKFPFVFGG